MCIHQNKQNMKCMNAMLLKHLSLNDLELFPVNTNIIHKSKETLKFAPSGAHVKN